MRLVLPACATLIALMPANAPADEPSAGEKLAFLHCGRCHVVSPEKRMGGIGSTPSFMVLRTFPDWEERMSAFWTLRPHPSFTQIDGVTEPFAEDRPAHVHPIRLTLDQVERIVAYARTVAPADLGGTLDLR